MTGPDHRQPSTWSRTAVPAARRWVVIPLVLAILGGVAGVTAGATSKASAEALLLVRDNPTSGVSSDLIAENAAVQLSTREIFTAAAAAAGSDIESLQQRSEIAAVPNSQTVSITVTAATTDAAIAEADAIAQAGVAAGPNRAPAAIAQLTEATRDLIASDDLGNSTAERARVDRLGDELGGNQAALVANANQIQLLQGGEAAARLPGAPVLGLLGALCGAFIGLAIALLLGLRRGTVRSARTLADLYPHAAVISPSDLRQTLAMEPDASTVIVAGTRGTRLTGATQAVQEALVVTMGKQVRLSDNLAGAPVVDSPNGHIDLVTTTLSETVLRRARRDPASVLIVPIQAGVTKLEAVDGFATRLADRSYLLVEEGTPEWD